MWNFFEAIEKVANEHNFSASHVWNCDITDFPTDTGACKVIAPKRKQSSKLTSGVSRENIYVLATCTNSLALDSLVIFSGGKFPKYLEWEKPLA